MKTEHAQGMERAGTPTKDRIFSRWGALQNERSQWMDQYRELSRYVLPRTGQFLKSDRNKGNKKHQSIRDNEATRALRILGAGMMAGATSPARPWFKLETADADLNKNEAVKTWLKEVTDIVLMIFARSNTYRALHSGYEELGLYGTFCNLILPNYDNVIHNYSMTAGQYCLATDPEGKVNAVYREFEKTVAEVVNEFGMDKVSPAVQNLHGNGSLQAPVNLLHIIEPRADREPGKIDKFNMPYASIYIEQGSDDNKYLREGGFNQFRVTAPRWAVTGGDTYGNSPGMDSIGDIKQLMHQQLRKAQAIDYQTNPPLQAPPGVTVINRMPGGITHVEQVGPQNSIQSAFEVNLDLQHLTQDMHEVRQRIQSGFYADLFLMMANATDTRMTATEVAERHEEKLLMLGPVIERLHNELLDPLVSITYQTADEAGILPPAPEEIADMELNIVFVSMLAQAQRAVGLNSVDRLVGGIGGIAAMMPDVLDKFDVDAWADGYSDMLGADPALIISTEEANKLRAARAEAAQAQAQVDGAQQMASTAKDVNAAGGDPFGAAGQG